MNIQEKIVQIALSEIGKRELKGNSGWEDKQFEKRMIETGWSTGQSWCAYYAEKVAVDACKAINPAIAVKVEKLFSANAVRTFENFKKSKFITTKEPQPGDIVIWVKNKEGKPISLAPGWSAGHAGIVIAPRGNFFETVEGNGNSSGGREGIEVARLIRKLDFNIMNGLSLLGFIRIQ